MDKLNITKAVDKVGTFYHTHPEISRVYRNKRTGVCTAQLMLLARTEASALTKLKRLIDPVNGRWVSVADLNYVA